MTSPATERPAHVPAELCIDFDYRNPGPPGSDPFETWSELIGAPPLVWTHHYGGHWIVTRGDLIPTILKDHERFSSRQAFIGTPPERPRAVPLEYDPPEHGPLRKLLMPAFLPKAVKVWSEEARRLAIDLIEGFKAQGQCEFVADFAQQLPMIIFLKIVDLPLEDREKLVAWVNTGLRGKDQQVITEARMKLNDYISDLVDERLANPGDDLLSQSIHADIGDGPMSREQAVGLAAGLLGGGLDTVAAMMSWIALFLAENPEHRAALVAEPKRIPKAIEEFMRRFSIANLARVVREDTELEGVTLKAGEPILIASCVHGLDERSFECPFDVNFDRRDSYKHSTLSHGIHRCIGAPLASQEIIIFLQEWLARIPDFTTIPDDPPIMSTGIVHGLERLPLQWTPG